MIVINDEKNAILMCLILIFDIRGSMYLKSETRYIRETDLVI